MTSTKLLMHFVKKYGALIFLALLLAHLCCIYWGPAPWRTVSKLVLIPFLLLYLSASREGIVHPLVVAGLVCSFAGDVFLAFSGEIFFLAGMFAFICTHVCNLAYFVKLRRAVTPSGGREFIPAMAGYMIVLGCYVMFHLFNHLGNLRVPIIVYMLIISAMAIAAAGTSLNALIRKAAVLYFMPGAALFALSDGILAMNKFAWHEPMADLAVMATYGAAQFCLVKGFIKITQIKVHSPGS